MRTVALLDSYPRPADAQIIEGLNGSLCRCCGYPRVLAAVKRAAGAAQQEAKEAGHVK
jgi:aerobic-type carbon monoxide dehydrogenase small subunit (CoxS/CutS family)